MFDGKYFDWNQKRIKGIVDYYGYKFFYGKKLADLGCGHADMSGVLYRLGSDITAVDARQDHLKIVTKKFPGIKTVKGNLDGPWPFHGQNFDVVMDLGLICHLAAFENHLKVVCSSTTYLVLETAVCDSDDPYKCIQVPEGKEVYDLSYNGMGCRPSAAAIERVLAECHMSFKRVDNARFNSGDYVYDWQPKNDGSTSISKRRIWFCTKNQPGVILPENAGQPAVVVQPPSSPSVYVHFNNVGVPTVLGGGGGHIGPPPPVFTASPKPPMTETSHLARPHSNGVKETSERFAITPEQPIPQYPHLKVFYVSLGSQTGTVDAFKRVGVKLESFDFYNFWLDHNRSNSMVANEFLRRVKEFQPNLIHMQLQFTGLLGPHIINEARRSAPGVVITNWSGDVRAHAIPDFIAISNSIDYALISSTGQLDMYTRAGCKNIKYWQIGYDPKTSFPKNQTRFKYDLSFLGNNYGASFPDGPARLHAVNTLRAKLGAKFGLFGSGYIPLAPMVDPSQANDVYNESVCALSISNFNNIAHYFSDRLLYCLASGRPTITWYFPGVEDYFVDGKEIFIARSPEDVMDIVTRCKNNPDLANEVGMNGYQKALREHTFTSRVLELIHLTNLDKPTGDHDKTIL